MIIGFLARHSAKPLKVDDATRNVCGRDYTLFVAITATTNVSKAHCETLAIELLGRNPCVVIAHSNTAFVQDIVKAKSNPQGWAGAAAIVVVEPEAGVLAGMLQSIDLSHLCTSDATNSSAELEDDESSWMVSERKLAGKVKNTHQKKSIEKKRKHDSHSTSKAVSAGGLVDTSARLTRLKFVVIDREPLFEVLASSTAAQSRVLHATVFGMELRRKIEYAHYAFGKVFDVFNSSSTCIPPVHERTRYPMSWSSSTTQPFEVSEVSLSNSSDLPFEMEEVLRLTFCNAFCLQKQIHSVKHRLISFMGLLQADYSSSATLHSIRPFETTDDYNAETKLENDKESLVPSVQCFTLGDGNSTIRTTLPELGFAPYNSDSFKHLYDHWDSLLNASSECTSSYTPLAEQEEHNSWWIDVAKRDEALSGLINLDKSLSWTGPGEQTVAVIVLGSYRVFDGTWPSHQRFIYDPIRLDPTTKYLDVFTCTDTHKIPAGMLKPAASFVAPPTSSMFERFDHCFKCVAMWAKDHWNATAYDVYIRIRPDMEMAYELPWPLPNQGSPLYGDVHASIYLGNIRAYPWADNVTLAMIGRGHPFVELLNSNGHCIRHKNSVIMNLPRLNDPCVDITDNVAIIRGYRVAEQYFCLNSSCSEHANSQVRDSRPTGNDLRNNQCSAMWQTWANEAVISHRVRVNAGATIAPYDFGGSFLAPMRKEPMSCTNKATGSLKSCASKAWLRKLNLNYYDSLKARGVKLNCIFGKQAKLNQQNDLLQNSNASVTDVK
jgi:hypothetical protein